MSEQISRAERKEKAKLKKSALMEQIQLDLIAFINEVSFRTDVDVRKWVEEFLDNEVAKYLVIKGMFSQPIFFIKGFGFDKARDKEFIIDCLESSIKRIHFEIIKVARDKEGQND